MTGPDALGLVDAACRPAVAEAIGPAGVGVYAWLVLRARDEDRMVCVTIGDVAERFRVGYATAVRYRLAIEAAGLVERVSRRGKDVRLPKWGWLPRQGRLYRVRGVEEWPEGMRV